MNILFHINWPANDHVGHGCSIWVMMMMMIMSTLRTSRWRPGAALPAQEGGSYPATGKAGLSLPSFPPSLTSPPVILSASELYCTHSLWPTILQSISACFKSELQENCEKILRAKHWRIDAVGVWLSQVQTIRDPASFNSLPSLKARKIQTMANQNNLGLTRQDTCIRFGLQASHVVCKDANNPIQQNPTTCQSHSSFTLYWFVIAVSEYVLQVANVVFRNQYNHRFVCLVVWTQASWAEWCVAATSQHMFSCDAASLALCTSNSARAENKPKYVGADLKTGINNGRTMLRIYCSSNTNQAQWLESRWLRNAESSEGQLWEGRLCFSGGGLFCWRSCWTAEEVTIYYTCYCPTLATRL